MTDRPFLVVGADGSDMSVAALEWAVQYARRVGAEIRVVTAFDIPWTILVTPTYTDDDYAQDAQEMLDRTLGDVTATAPDVPIVTELLQMRPALALTTAARGADLLVVGSQGHGELPGMHLGSVANYCVHHAPCPVVVVRPHVE